MTDETDEPSSTLNAGGDKSQALTSVSSVSAFYKNLAMANAVAHQQAMMQLQMAITGKIAEQIINSAEGGADVATLMKLFKQTQDLPPKLDI